MHMEYFNYDKLLFTLLKHFFSSFEYTSAISVNNM